MKLPEHVENDGVIASARYSQKMSEMIKVRRKSCVTRKSRGFYAEFGRNSQDYDCNMRKSLGVNNCIFTGAEP